VGDVDEPGRALAREAARTQAVPVSRT
jgi:hypothetical protein